MEPRAVPIGNVQMDRFNTDTPDGRARHRPAILLAAVLTYDHGAHSADCTIRDLNELGARIGVAGGSKYPASIYIVNMRDRLVYEARVVWHRMGQLGVEFERTLRLSEINDPALIYLRRLWIERAVR